jgi:ATP-dependent DNA helicase
VTSPKFATPQPQKRLTKKARTSLVKTASPAPQPATDKEMDPTPVFLTTYEMIIRDRTHLAAFEWRYIIVDEGV